MLTIAVW